MMDISVHGVALVKVGAGPIDPREFYGVFFRGVLQPTQFESWAEAHAHFVKMDGSGDNWQHQALTYWADLKKRNEVRQ